MFSAIPAKLHSLSYSLVQHATPLDNDKTAEDMLSARNIYAPTSQDAPKALPGLFDYLDCCLGALLRYALRSPGMKSSLRNLISRMRFYCIGLLPYTMRI